MSGSEQQPLPGTLGIPSEVLGRYRGWRFTVAYQYGAPAITYRMDSSGGETHFLKLAPPDAHPSLVDEAARMRWACDYLSAPEVVGVGAGADVYWLATVGLPGHDATAPRWKGDPERLVRSLAAGLRRMHELSVEACPFDFRLEVALPHVMRRVEQGQVLPERDFHPEYEHYSAETALAVLLDTRPATEDLVVCHGDFCLPNLLLEDWEPTGWIDLGELGVADRWWDVAVATWSISWNLGPGLEDLFLDAYGVARDDDRIAYYRLLYDVVS